MRVLPELLRWIAAHFRTLHAALGVLLTVGLAISVGSILVFAAMALLVAGGAIQRTDDAVLLWMYAHSTPLLDTWALQLTALGSTVVVVMVVLVASAFLWIGRHRWSVALLWIAMLGGAVLNTVLKEVFARPRPMLWERMYAGAASFPSGHAMSAVAIYGTLAYLVARLEQGRRMRRLTFAVAAAVILIIGASRIYLGVHYPSDIIAGYSAALAWVAFCAIGIELVNHMRTRRRTSDGGSAAPGG